MHQPTESSPNGSENLPLTPMQQGMLFHSLYAPGTGLYVEQVVCDIDEPLDLPLLRSAWLDVVAAHSMLRTAFRWEGVEQPVQDEHAAVPLPWQVIDWMGLSASEQDKRTTQFLEADRSQGFDLKTPPLCRYTLIRLGEAQQRFIWTYHHGLLDGWSVFLVLRDVWNRYDALVAGRDLQLEQGVSYRRFVESLQQKDGLAAEEFWRAQLKGFDAATKIRSAGHRSEVGGDDFRTREGVLSPAASADLFSFAAQHRITPSTIIYGAWALLLSRYSGNEDVLFGTTLAGRQFGISGIEETVGLFINTVPVRFQVRRSSPVLEWLQAFREQADMLRQHEQTPLTTVQGCSELKGGGSLFDTLVVVNNGSLNSLLQKENKAWARRRCVALPTRTNYLLSLNVFLERPTILRLDYSARQFDEPAIERMMGHLQTLISQLVADPQQSLGNVAMLTDAERLQILVQWNDTKVDYPYVSGVHRLIEAQVERDPEAIAVRMGEGTLTYRELNQRANQLAHRLRRLNVGAEVLVGLCLERSIEMIVGLLGILKAGGAYVPIDPAYPKDRLAFLLEDTRAPVILTQEKFLHLLPPTAAQLLCLDSGWRDIAGESSENPIAGDAPDNLAYVIYTSGSTGRPKGVMNTHKGICNRLLWMQSAYGLNATDRVLQKTPFTFDVSVWEFLWPLITGAQLVFARPGGHQDPHYLTDLIADAAISTVHFVPSMLQVFLDQTDLARCRSLRRVFCSGEALPAKLVEKYYSLIAADLHNLYGPTEAAVDVTYWPCPRNATAATVPIGKPVANTQIYVLDSDLKPVPVGVPGELHIGGVQVARGYLNRPELTREKFIPDPFSGAGNARLYKSGDLACFHSDGNIEYLGRLDFQVKIRGFRIELGEIEAKLSQHPSVSEAVVTVREDTPGERSLVAYVSGEHSSETELLRDHLRSFLPDYMIPAAYVQLASMPLSANGKIDRSALPAPDRSRRDLRHPYVGARDEIEETLIRVWQEVLQRDEIGVHDNFFEMGGHSLLAVKVYARLREEFVIDLPLVTLFRHPTVAELAVPIADAQRDRYRTSAERGAQWKYLRQFQPGHGKRPIYMIPGGIGGEVDVEFFFYARLAHFVGADYPFFGLRPKGADGREEPHLSAREMARDYLDEIRRHQPKGPYFLAGACIGGALAYEMACQLESLGQQVAFLGLLDTVRPTLRQYVKYRAQPWIERLRANRRRIAENYYLRRVAHHWRELNQLTWSERVSYLRGRSVAALSDLERSMTPTAAHRARLDEAAARELAVVNPRLRVFQESYERALRRYRPRQYHGKLTLLNAEEVVRVHGSTGGWRGRVASKIEEHRLPGNHITLFRQDVKLLAAQLRECLERAAAR